MVALVVYGTNHATVEGYKMLAKLRYLTLEEIFRLSKLNTQYRFRFFYFGYSHPRRFLQHRQKKFKFLFHSFQVIFGMQILRKYTS